MRILFFLLFLLPSAYGAEYGVVMDIKGEAVVGVKPIKGGDKVELGDVVTTAPKSFVRILLPDGIALQVGPDSTMKIERKEGEPATIELLKGMLLSRVKKTSPVVEHDRFRVRTRTAAIGVRGTTFFVKEESDGKTFLCLCEGTVTAKWAKGERKITAKHHDHPVRIAASEAKAEDAPMGADHTDDEIEALDKLLH